jgi:hypothetical protein
MPSLLTLRGVGDVPRDPKQILRHAEVVLDRDLLGMQKSCSVMSRLDGLFGNLDHHAAPKHLSVLAHEELGLLWREEVAIGFPEEIVPRPPEQLLTRSIEPHELERVRVLDEDHLR